MSDLVLIRWIDSIRHSSGWQTVEHYKREAEDASLNCETVGWEIHEDDQSVMVAQSRMVDEGGCVTEVIRIPKAAIAERRPLGETVKKAKRS